MIMKRLFINILFSLSSFAAMAQVYQYPMNKLARVNGTDAMFSCTPIANPSEVPLSSRAFFQKALCIKKYVCLRINHIR